MDAHAHRQTCRSIFISDLHLGARGCQAELLLDFLQHVDCRTLYLVGDIVDGWRLKRGWRWPPSHDAVVQHILALARRGVEVIYTPGNHDEFARAFYGVHLAGVVVAPEWVHHTADGRRFLVVHGDLYDGVVLHARWLALAGDWAYRGLLRANTAWNHTRRRLGLGYWSFARVLKSKVKQATRFVDDFEHRLAAEARRRGFDGVICGHIHKSEKRTINEVSYINDGDWVESCTAAIERLDGCIEIVDWAERRAWSMLDRSVSELVGCPPLQTPPLAA